ncbi:MAG: hypothetical protein U0794_05430 [Isosphaeraceae bacterium]
MLGFLGSCVGQLGARRVRSPFPDLFRERFGSPTLGLLTSVLIMVFLSTNLVAQFAAGVPGS